MVQYEVAVGAIVRPSGRLVAGVLVEDVMWWFEAVGEGSLMVREDDGRAVFVASAVDGIDRGGGRVVAVSAPLLPHARMAFVLLRLQGFADVLAVEASGERMGHFIASVWSAPGTPEAVAMDALVDEFGGGRQDR